MLALLDADIITYRIGFVTEQDEEWVAAARVDDLISSIMQDTKATHYKPFLTSTDKSNFRFKLYPEYKGNRKQPKPKHYEFIRQYLQDEHGAEVIFGEEADDALGYSQTEGSVICSIDKDLLMIPGKHYNFVKKELYTISKEEGLCNFYGQLLNGDVGDNIPGCPGIGPAKIAKVLHPDMNEEDMFKIVHDLYYEQYLKKNKERINCFEEDLLRNGRLLKIKQTKDEPLWEFPIGLD